MDAINDLADHELRVEQAELEKLIFELERRARMRVKLAPVEAWENMRAAWYLRDLLPDPETIRSQVPIVIFHKDEIGPEVTSDDILPHITIRNVEKENG